MFFSTAVDPELSNNDSKILSPGEIVTLTCETRATDNQTWIFINSSDPSIQDLITITSASEIGTLWLNRTILNNITSNIILEENYVKNGFQVLKTVFNITLLESTGHNHGNLSVTCVNGELGTNTITIVEVAGTYIIITFFFFWYSV